VSKLREAARGQQCYGRFIHHCNRNSETVSLAHIRLGGVGGTGFKPPDSCGLPLCSSCHDALDMRVKSPHSRAQLHADVLRGLCQWLEYCEKNGLITIGETA
jgi:hypothetical protein